MKKTFIILLLPIYAMAQNPKFPKIKLSVPCTEEFANNYKGKWLITTDKSNYSAEVKKRFQQLQRLLFETYPEPTGGDAAWNGHFAKASFADQVKFETKYYEAVKTNKVYRYDYNLIIYPWDCCGSNEICNIYPEISGGVGLTIVGNQLDIISSGNFMSGDLIGNEWTIDGRPIKKKKPAMGTWKGYEVMASEGGSLLELAGSRYVLICRNGMLPYIPVTRKEFFDRAFLYVTKFYDNAIASTDQLTDKTDADDSKKTLIKEKSSDLKRLKDELDKTTQEGLLSSPAIISPYGIMFTTEPLFATEQEGGQMLVTENQNYFRKDLPNYVPQFFVLTWSWKTKGYGATFTKEVNDNFPIEKLKAMIDK
jgi:hypothetical protein